MKINKLKMAAIILLLILIGVNLIVHYLSRNFAYTHIWYHRLIGDDTLQIGNTKIKAPENCITRDHKKHTEVIMSFLCATSPTKYSTVNIFRIHHEDFIKYIKENQDLHIKTFAEFDNYIFITVEIKDSALFSLYHLKRQNINVSSDSSDLAKKFADLLAAYDFRVDNETPDGQIPID